MIEKIYYWLHGMTARPGERGEPSAGYLQNRIRQAALKLCRSRRGRLLEVGCGEGLFLSQLVCANPCIEAWGVDIDPAMIKKASGIMAAKGIVGVNLSEGQAQKLPFADSFFDFVVMVNVIICMNSHDMVRAALKEISRVLKPDGRIFIEFRNKRNILFRIKYRFAKYYDHTLGDHPMSMYYEGDVVSLLAEAGFTVVLKKYVGLFSPVVILEAKSSKGQKYV